MARKLGFISFGTIAVWYLVVLGSAIYLAVQPASYQNWWMIPWMWGAYLVPCQS